MVVPPPLSLLGWWGTLEQRRQEDWVFRDHRPPPPPGVRPPYPPSRGTVGVPPGFLQFFLCVSGYFCEPRIIFQVFFSTTFAQPLLPLATGRSPGVFPSPLLFTGYNSEKTILAHIIHSRFFFYFPGSTRKTLRCRTQPSDPPSRGTVTWSYHKNARATCPPPGQRQAPCANQAL